ncbi:MAG: DUF4956 domain-containing protein [Chloroflexi bacterium]|nr:DUF4956 domain-containing protein [Chloroflexota bacterium]
MNVFSDSQDILSLNQELSFLGSGQFFINLTVALVCGLLIGLFYRWTFRKKKHSTTFFNSLVALSMITTIVITVIGNNLARAFGLVGALSIVRFRMSVKNMKDIVFIFFALAVGMAAGVNLLMTAITGTIFIGVVMLVLYRLPKPPRAFKFTLRFSLTSTSEITEQQALYQPILEKYCKRYELTKTKLSENQDALVLSFSGVLKRNNGKNLVLELEQIPEIAQVTLKFKSRKRRKKKKAK